MSKIFLTAEDPDYRIKGSRDPLGLQVVWQQTGRQVIPHLSTVSSHLADFQTLALAELCRRHFQISEALYPAFLLRWEQLMAYVRKGRQHREILGIVRVNQHWEQGRLPVASHASKPILLESQRSVGVWGRYSAPFRESGAAQAPNFETVFAPKMAALWKHRLVRKCVQEEQFSVDKKRLQEETFLGLHQLADEERAYWKQYLLADQCQDDWRRQFDRHSKRVSFANARFFTDLDILQENAPDSLVMRLQQIAYTERLLCPLNRAFRYLQTRAAWSMAELEGDAFLEKCRRPATYLQPEYFDSDDKRRLLSLLASPDNLTLVAGLAERNRQVAESRAGAPWLALGPHQLEVYHHEGAIDFPAYDPALHHDNSYFFYTYQGLYLALHNPAIS